jgi:hypothetical protein
MPLYTFSVGEVIHAGVLLEISAFGVLQATRPVPVTLIKRTPAALTEPARLIEVYEAERYDVCIEFITSEVHIDGASTRNKKAVRTYMGFLRSPIYFRAAMDKWLIEERPEHSFGMVITMPSKLIIHIGYLAYTVASKLGLDQLWHPLLSGHRRNPPKYPGKA